MPISDPSAPDLPPEQTAEIIQVLQAVCPLETEFLGPTTVEDILAGAEFKPVQGGGHIDLSLTISLVSCVASLAQLTIKIWELRRPPAETERQARVAISEYVSVRVELAQIISQHPELPEQVIEAVKRLRRANPPPA